MNKEKAKPAKPVRNATKEPACKKLSRDATKEERAAARKQKMSLKKLRREALQKDYEAMRAKQRLYIKPNLSTKHPNVNKPIQEAYK